MQQTLAMTPFPFFYNKLKISPRSLEMHICATDARQASDRYPNNGLIFSRCEQHRMGTWSGKCRRGKGGEQRRTTTKGGGK